MSEVTEQMELQLPELESVNFFYSEHQGKTQMRIKYKEDSAGFKREYFSFGKRSAGTKLLIRQEVPQPWSQCLRGFAIEKQQKAFFAESTDIQFKGPDAKQLYDELMEQKNERKRDKKERLKQKMKEMEHKDKVAFRKELASQLEEKYILSC